nr:hypothetical protein [uncultured Tolumonas sp.]
MESLTKKEKIAQYLLSQNKWMSAVEVAEDLGIDKKLVHSAMGSVMREKRYAIKSKLVPCDVVKGPKEIKQYLITAIEPAKTKAVKQKEREQKMDEPQIRWISDPVSIRARLRDCIANVRCEAAL